MVIAGGGGGGGMEARTPLHPHVWACMQHIEFPSRVRALAGQKGWSGCKPTRPSCKPPPISSVHQHVAAVALAQQHCRAGPAGAQQPPMGKRPRAPLQAPRRPQAPWESSKRPRDTVVRVGTDFSGLDVVVAALKATGVKVEHVFSSDIDPKVRGFLQHQHTPANIYQDVRDRQVNMMPPVDLYAFGPPCQTFSSAGLRQGIRDDRGKLFAFGLEYIAHHHPALVLFENVSKIRNHKEVMGMITDSLASCGYDVHQKLLNTMCYGCPQHRERLYVIGISRASGGSAFEFPAGVSSPLPLTALIPRLPEGQWQHLPPPCKKSDHANGHLQKIVASQLAKVAEKGINPFVRPVCIDTGNSEKWQHSTVDHVMTLTRSHCQSFSYWLTSKGGFLDVNDFIRLQGMAPEDVDYKAAGLKDRDVAGMLGNSMSANVLQFLLPSMLQAGDFITARKRDSLLKDARARWGGGTSSASGVGGGGTSSASGAGGGTSSASGA